MEKLKSPEYYMKIALKEAKKGQGMVSPNPLVGAVIVDPISGKIISKGYHKVYGGEHAEVVAIKKAKEKIKNTYLFVTLEPCNHYGKTPPCSKLIVEKGIKKVFCAIRDPNPIATGGLKFLKENGIEIEIGILSQSAVELNKGFISVIKRGIPWVILKVASSLDGKISTSTGASKWITCEKARKFAHKLRAICDAILVGKNTVLKDDPLLTCRLAKGKNPIRIVLDSHLSLSPSYKVFDTALAPSIIVCGENACSKKEKAFIEKGVEVWKVPLKNNKIDLFSLLKRCKEKGINLLLVEGGGKVHGTFLSEGLVDEIFYAIGPIIIGDPKGTSAISGKSLSSLEEAYSLFDLKVKKLGKSFVFHGYTQRGYFALKEWSKTLSSFNA